MKTIRSSIRFQYFFDHRNIPFLELSTNAHKYWAAANPTQKHKISEILLLNLVVNGKDIQSITYKEPFSKWLNRAEINNGGYART